MTRPWLLRAALGCQRSVAYEEAELGCALLGLIRDGELAFVLANRRLGHGEARDPGEVDEFGRGAQGGVMASSWASVSGGLYRPVFLVVPRPVSSTGRRGSSAHTVHIMRTSCRDVPQT